MSGFVTIRFVVKVSPLGGVKIYREVPNLTLGEAYLLAQSEQEEGDILRTVQVQIKIPQDRNKPKEPGIDIDIKLE